VYDNALLLLVFLVLCVFVVGGVAYVCIDLAKIDPTRTRPKILDSEDDFLDPNSPAGPKYYILIF